MSEHALPDDVRKWPSDPAALLGVPENADRKTLRRAYSKLIRRYKPEHAPDEFQALRSAYDSLLQICDWRENFSVDISPADTFHSEDDGETPSRDDSDGWSPAAFVDTNRQIDDLWTTAKTGQFAAAYREYESLIQSRPGSEEVALRLYWLLKLAPQIDPRRTPVDWLFEAMQMGGVTSRLVTLYREELAEDPLIATTPRAVKLLGVNAPTGYLAQLAYSHIETTAKLRHWDALGECLDTLRPRFAVDDTETWVRLLTTALDEIAFSFEHRAVNLDEQIRKELEENEHLQLPLGYAFDRAELLRVLTEECRHPDIPARLVKLLAASWSSDTAEYHPRLLAFLEPWVVNPDFGLKELDALAINGTVVLGRLTELLEYAANGAPTFDQSEGAVKQLKCRLRKLLAMQRWPTYGRLRIPLRNFCLKEGVPLKAVEYFLASDPEYFLLSADDGQMLHELSEDNSLACLLLAHQAFWNTGEE